MGTLIVTGLSKDAYENVTKSLDNSDRYVVGF